MDEKLRGDIGVIARHLMLREGAQPGIREGDTQRLREIARYGYEVSANPVSIESQILDRLAIGQTTTTTELRTRFGRDHGFASIMFGLEDAGHFVLDAAEPEAVWRRVR